MQTPESNRFSAEEFIRNFASVFQYVRIYAINHPLSKSKIQELHSYLLVYFQETKSQRFIFGVVMKELVADKEVLIELSKVLAGFISLLEQRHIEKIAIERDISMTELEQFIDILVDTEHYPADKPFAGFLAQKNITHIKIGALATEAGPQGDEQSSSTITIDAGYTQRFYAALITAITTILEKVFNQFADDKDCTMFVNLVDQLGQNMDQDFESLFRIFGYLKTRNNYEYIHSAHVAILTIIQARSLNLDKSLVSRIGVAAFMHDVGKLSIPVEILNKPAALTKEEFEIMKTHPVHGANLLTKYSDSFGELPVIVSFMHHMKYDCTGYPQGLKYCKDTHMAARLATIADIYDALRSSRAYRAGIPSEKVYEMMIKEKGTTFDPVLLDNFFRLVGIWSPGTVVQLNNGMIGIVRAVNANFPECPQVEVFYDRKDMISISPIVLDLERERNYHVTKSLTMEEISDQRIPVPENYII